MKTTFIFATILASATSFAHTCHISLYDPYNRPYLNFYSSNDYNCQEAAKKCYQTITDNRLHPDYYKCYTISMTEDTQSSRPVSHSNNDQEYRRDLESGETVLFQGTNWIVVDKPENGVFDLMPVGGKKKDIVKNVDRSYISITRGCLRNVCTKSSVMFRRTNTSMSVEGITYEGRYIVKDVASGQMLEVEASEIYN